MSKILQIRILLALLAFAVGGLAAAQDEDILHPEEAFAYAVVDTGSELEIDWALAKGYYLYKNKLSFGSGSSNVVFGSYELPEGRHHEDEFFGVQQVYRERFYVTIPYSVVGERPANMDLVIKSQGCADLGICFPPQIWNADVKLASVSNDKPKFSLDGSVGGMGDAVTTVTR